MRCVRVIGAGGRAGHVPIEVTSIVDAVAAGGLKNSNASSKIYLENRRSG